MDWKQLRDDLISEARRAGWASAGVTTAAPFALARDRALQAISEGRMEGMEWYTPERVEAACDLASRYSWAQSVVALAWPYRRAPPPPDLRAVAGRPRGRISAYACLPEQGQAVDYHDLLAGQCAALLGWLGDRVPGVRAKRFIDHGWAMDRAVAERAGIGFAGKNACLITTEAGSYVMLAEIVLSIPLPVTAPNNRGCGTCRRCIPACPTGAIKAPGVIDATRCISYLTIEHRGPIPFELRPLIGTWAFGCDLCQEVCPINTRLAADPLEAGTASIEAGPVPFPDLVACLEIDDEEFRRRFRHTALWRTGRAGLARNAAIALGNAGDAGATAALSVAAATDPDEVVREAARWAIDRLSTQVATSPA